MHSFVFSFFEQRVDPTIVSLHRSQGPKMSVHGCNKPWHTCNGFQEEHPIQPVFLSDNILLPREHLSVSAHNIKAESQRLNEGISEVISEVSWTEMSDLNLFDFLFCPDRVRHCPFFRFENFFLCFDFFLLLFRSDLEVSEVLHGNLRDHECSPSTLHCCSGKS